VNPVRLVTPSDAYPVTVTQAKEHLKITVEDENSLIESYLNAAIRRCEDYRQSNIMSAEYELMARAWPYCGWVNLQKSPVSAINSVKYYDEDNNLQTVSPSSYRLQDYRVPARLEFDSSFSQPDLHDREFPIIVNFQAGYLAASSVPATLKHAILLEMGTLHEIRQSETIGNGLTVVQMKEASMNMIDAETLWL
jgi:uncharacterized phiE125 gp8 family phage protein